MLEKCTVDDVKPVKKRNFYEGKGTGTTAMCEAIPHNDFSPLLCIQLLYIMLCWVDPGTIMKQLTVASLFPFSVVSSDFSVLAAEDGCELKITTMSWPDPLMNIDTLHRKWLQSD